jgi:hypothetical protein
MAKLQKPVRDYTGGAEHQRSANKLLARSGNDRATEIAPPTKGHGVDSDPIRATDNATMTMVGTGSYPLERVVDHCGPQQPVMFRPSTYI